MKKLLLAGAALLSLMTAASAADLAARPYTKAPRSYTGKFLAPVLAKVGKPRKSGASEAAE